MSFVELFAGIFGGVMLAESVQMFLDTRISWNIGPGFFAHKRNAMQQKIGYVVSSRAERNHSIQTSGTLVPWLDGLHFNVRRQWIIDRHLHVRVFWRGNTR